MEGDGKGQDWEHSLSIPDFALDKAIRMKLRHFLQYLRHNRDDSPLYIFDATFDEDKYAKRILEDYTVPEYFNEDLLGLVGERRRPPYRWFLVGPCRSGTTVHIDPLGTSAWNTLVHGVKRWVLFPPHVSKSVVKGRKLILPAGGGQDDEAIHYFTTILPRMKRRAAGPSAEGRDGDSSPPAASTTRHATATSSPSLPRRRRQPRARDRDDLEAGVLDDVPPPRRESGAGGWERFDPLGREGSRILRNGSDRRPMPRPLARATECNDAAT